MQPTPFLKSKGPLVAGSIALTLGLSGFFMGLRQTHSASADQRTTWTQSAPTSEAGLVAHPTAPRYADIPTGVLRANREWSNHLANHQEPVTFTHTVFTRTPAEQTKARHLRAALRQYDGAPPVSPHPLDQQNPAACLSCHGKPTTIDGQPVAQISHPHLTNCLQCHVSGAGPTSTWRGNNLPGLFEENSFTGHAAPLSGTRAYNGAPPVIPHAQWMRENCLSCHGPGGSSAMRSSHPDRQSCLQCHATTATLDPRRVVLNSGNEGLPPPLSGQ